MLMIIYIAMSTIRTPGCKNEENSIVNENGVQTYRFRHVEFQYIAFEILVRLNELVLRNENDAWYFAGCSGDHQCFNYSRLVSSTVLEHL